jgi:pyruvate/2-oxoglutarate dehydrogenase complex dihydrolipoamide dehydrogenase (E3) component
LGIYRNALLRAEEAAFGARETSGCCQIAKIPRLFLLMGRVQNDEPKKATMDEYDFAVIGAGSAGYGAATEAAKLGLRTISVEGAADVGGLCILRGCMPSKTLLESANRFLSLRRAQEFGLSAGHLGFDVGAIRRRKRSLINGFADYRRSQLEKGKFDFVRAYAAFIDPHQLRLEGLNGSIREIRFRTALISTGSELNVIDLPGLTEMGYLDSDIALDSDRVPASIIILGGGAIALEFAHFYNALGTKVTVLQRSPQFIKEADADVAAALTEAYRRNGVEMISGTKLVAIEKKEDRKVVRFVKDGQEHAMSADEVFYALGRRAAISRLHLDAAQVKMDENSAVGVNDLMQTSQPHIFAAGDATGQFDVVHIGIEQATAAARNAARWLRNEELTPIDYRLRLFAIFSHPELAIVGLTEKQAKAEGRRVRVATYPFDDHGKSMIRGETQGLVKLIADADTQEILGGAVVGPEASELIHEIVVAMHFRAKASDLAAIPHYHPTLSEIWTYPAEELAAYG